MRNLIICFGIAIFSVLFYIVFIEGPPMTGGALVLCILLFASLGIKLLIGILRTSEDENTEDKD